MAHKQRRPLVRRRRRMEYTEASGSVVHIHAYGPDGEVDWNSRWHRKRRRHRPLDQRSWSWWLALSFSIGSILFVLGGAAAMATSGRLGAWLNLWGSFAFSTGCLVAVVEADDACRRLQWTRGLRGLWSTAGGRAAVIQFAAGGFFQLAMIVAMDPDLTRAGANLWVWTPSAIGSVGFVASSRIAVQEARPAADIGTAAAAANLVGSVCFVVGSVAGYVAEGPFRLPGSDLANPVFVLGSLLFLVGSGVGLVELEEPLAPDQTAFPPPDPPN